MMLCVEIVSIAIVHVNTPTLLVFIELVQVACKSDNHILEKKLTYFASTGTKPDMRDIEEALLQAVRSGADDNIAPLILAGARR